MSLLKELTSIANGLGLPAETGVYSGTPPTTYLVLTPMIDSFHLHADNRPGMDTQEVRISLFTKGSFTQTSKCLVRVLLNQDITITDRRYIGHEDDTGYCISFPPRQLSVPYPTQSHAHTLGRSSSEDDHCYHQKDAFRNLHRYRPT